MFNILLLYCLREKFDYEQLRPVMDIDITCGLMTTGIHHLVKCDRIEYAPLTDLDNQKNLVERMSAGCYCYIRGPIGWYDWIYNRSQVSNIINLDTVYQGENVLSIGNGEFIAFSRDYNGIKMPHPQLVIKSFDYILEELERNGREQLSKVYNPNSITAFLSGESNKFRDANKYQVAGLECIQHLVFLIYY